ncbi:coxsackievirus and adenovirus receptor homolog isoform X1 [Lates japonicus]|uniref:Coxsackievirus and adenovirus receptor homolog isoform X1 n=1 Tax=Lates japonicus TaxID=270547 RepID=A0AAD3RGG8_LATJO|nr:coxsackievirus and adenovirus receptor homolog isoform X1 [Lates japonicus]
MGVAPGCSHSPEVDKEERSAQDTDVICQSPCRDERRHTSSVSSHREKMICWILLLIKLTSCVCAGTFVVNVTQTSYQAEENHNITLDWTFTTTTHRSLDSISIICELIIDQKVSVLFHLHEGVEVSESQDEQFSGRVQFDKDVLREGRLRLHVSRLRTEDSGLHRCKVHTNYGWSSEKCRLNVTGKLIQLSCKRRVDGVWLYGWYGFKP